MEYSSIYDIHRVPRRPQEANLTEIFNKNVVKKRIVFIKVHKTPLAVYISAMLMKNLSGMA